MTDNALILEVDGEEVAIEVEELSQIEQMQMAAKAPDSMLQSDPSDVRVDKDVIDFLLDLVESQTVLTRELLNELDQEQISYVLNCVVAYSFGEEPDFGFEETEDRTIDFNSDGSVDLDDWE